MNEISAFDLLKYYIVTLVVFLAIDMVWLLVISKKLYAEKLGYLLAESPNLIAAFIFYFLFAAGVLFFVIQPALTAGSLQYAIFAGLFFGLVTYATYDLTNMATIRDWPAIITVIDLIWGSFLTASTSSISYLIIMKFLKH